MLNRKIIEEAARELGAAKFGVGDLSLFDGEDPKRDPKFICPNARCIVGFGIPVPKGLYKTMKEEREFYGYTTLGVKAVDDVGKTGSSGQAVTDDDLNPGRGVDDAFDGFCVMLVKAAA